MPSMITYSPKLKSRFVEFTLPGLPATPENLRYAPLLDVLVTMERTGGGYHSRLASAWLLADPKNNSRLCWAYNDGLEDFAQQVPAALLLTYDQAFSDALTVKAA